MKTNKQKMLEAQKVGQYRPDNTEEEKKYTDNFNIIFSFFLKSYRCGILTFCGSDVLVNFDINSEEGKFVFRSFENGEYKVTTPTTRHPNIVKGVIIGKKSWGLWLNQWTDGISEGSFTKDEIFSEFEKHSIIIPEPLLNDFYNVLNKKILNKIRQI